MIDPSQIAFSPFEVWVLAAAVAAAALSGYRLWRIAQREEVQRLRLESFRDASPVVTRKTSPSWYRRFGAWIATSPIFGSVEQQRLVKLLAKAGIKGRGSFANFVASKLIIAVVLGGSVWLLLEWRQLFVSVTWLRYAMLGGALMLGWRLPDFVLSRIIKRRQLRLEKGMPDALDLLVVSAEAGLSLNQSIEEISRQMQTSNRDVADEFNMTSAEMQILPDFGQALDNLVERTGLSDLRSLIATLKQSIKFGTPLAESLRVIAREMRAARHARIEEKAARLPVLLAIPMMMFILPCIMLVVATPVGIRIIDVFKTLKF
jgi:tight adherence protein C